jgi:hypothetical protein
MVRRIRASLDDVLNDVQAIPALPDDLELFCVLQYHHQPLSHEHVVVGKEQTLLAIRGIANRRSAV